MKGFHSIYLNFSDEQAMGLILKAMEDEQAEITIEKKKPKRKKT